MNYTGLNKYRHLRYHKEIKRCTVCRHGTKKRPRSLQGHSSFVLSSLQHGQSPAKIVPVDNADKDFDDLDREILKTLGESVVKKVASTRPEPEYSYLEQTELTSALGEPKEENEGNIGPIYKGSVLDTIDPKTACDPTSDSILGKSQGSIAIFQSSCTAGTTTTREIWKKVRQDQQICVIRDS